MMYASEEQKIIQQLELQISVMHRKIATLKVEIDQWKAKWQEERGSGHERKRPFDQR